MLSLLVAADAIKAKSLIRIDVAMPNRRFFAVRHKERYITEAGRAFYGFVRARDQPL